MVNVELVSIIANIDVQRAEFEQVKKIWPEISEDIKRFGLGRGQKSSLCERKEVVLEEIFLKSRHYQFSLEDIIKIYQQISIYEKQFREDMFASPEMKSQLEKVCMEYQEKRKDGMIHPLIKAVDVLYDFFALSPFVGKNDSVMVVLVPIIFLEYSYDCMFYEGRSLLVLRDTIKHLWELRESRSCEDFKIEFSRELLSWLELIQNVTLNKLKRCGIGSGISKKLKTSKKNRIENVLLLCEEPITKSQICKCLPDVSKTTVELELGRLLKEGKIQKKGGGVATAYYISDTYLESDKTENEFDSAFVKRIVAYYEKLSNTMGEE